MDYIREFDIRLEKEMYYAGETLSGHVILDTSENFKLRAIRVVLRGKAHTEWKVVISGDRRTVKDDQYFIDDRTTIWGKEKAEGHVPILPRGMHQFPFKFQLPESSLPCSFESRAGTIRYYIKATVDIPYASPPQGMKYFTVIGPHIDCMEDQYLKPMVGQDKRKACCLCCERGPISLKTQLERSAYVCGESLRVKADIDNQTEEEVRLKLRLVQYVEYYIDRTVLGVTKEVSHTILEYRGPPVSPHTRSKWDAQQTLVVPTMPPTLLGVCRLIQVYYLLKVNVELEKKDDLHMHFPITIATVPFRIPNSNQQPVIRYEVATDHAEGGMYIGPEFQLGQVYDGGQDTTDTIVLYRPVYPTIRPPGKPLPVRNNSRIEVTVTNMTPEVKLKQSVDRNNSSSDSNTTTAVAGTSTSGTSTTIVTAGPSSSTESSRPRLPSNSANNEKSSSNKTRSDSVSSSGGGKASSSSNNNSNATNNPSKDSKIPSSSAGGGGGTNESQSTIKSPAVPVPGKPVKISTEN